MTTVTLQISAGNKIEYVEMPGVTAMWSAAIRVAEHVGIFSEDKRYDLSSSRTKFTVSDSDIAAEWDGLLLYLMVHET